jgi:hypothetical protein
VTTEFLEFAKEAASDAGKILLSGDSTAIAILAAGLLIVDAIQDATEKLSGPGFDVDPLPDEVAYSEMPGCPEL